MSLSEYFKNLPAPVQRSSLAVKSLQRKRASIQHEYNMACMTLEKQFQVKYQELNNRRLVIISGGRPTAIELSTGAEVTREDDEDYKPPPLNANVTAPITDFWLTAIRNHAELGNMVKEQDVPALQSLIDIQFSFLQATGPKPNFKLTFKFKSNEFFSNDVLEKTYYYEDEPDNWGDFVPLRSVGTKIRWKVGKNLTEGSEDGESSFFKFFTPPVPPKQSKQSRNNRKGDSDEDSDNEDEELEVYEEELEEDFARGEAFKDEAIPDAIDYFMHEKEDDDSDDEECDWDIDNEDSDEENKKATDDDDDDDDDDNDSDNSNNDTDNSDDDSDDEDDEDDDDDEPHDRKWTRRR